MGTTSPADFNGVVVGRRTAVLGGDVVEVVVTGDHVVDIGVCGVGTAAANELCCSILESGGHYEGC